MSVEGGLHRSLERGTESGCDAIQIFTRSGRQWHAPPVRDEEAARFRSALAAGAPSPAVAHASYLINMGSPDPALAARSLEALVDEIDRCEVLGLPFLIIHPGAHMGEGIDAGIARIARSLDAALERRPRAKVRVLLENTAGMGTSVGHTFGQLAAIRDLSRHIGRTGICIDTCHLFAAGYDISTERGYHEVFEELLGSVGDGSVLAFHLNDSIGELGCRLDRHEHIGRGRLGLTAFWCLMNDARFEGIPMILETPKGPGMEEDRINLALLRGQIGAPRPRHGRKVAAGAGRTPRRAPSREAAGGEAQSPAAPGRRVVRIRAAKAGRRQPAGTGKAGKRRKVKENGKVGKAGKVGKVAGATPARRPVKRGGR